MTAKTRSALTTQATTDLADNSTAGISEADVRGMATDIIDSAFNLLTDRGYGSIYLAGGSTTQTTNSSANTFDTVTGFVTNGASDGTLVTPTVASNKIILSAGTYLAFLTCSFNGTIGTTFTVRLYDNTNAIALTQCQLTTKIDTGGDQIASSATGIIAVAGTSDLIAQVACDGTSDSFTPNNMNLSVWRVGD